MGLISLVDEIQFMLISSCHICMRSTDELELGEQVWELVTVNKLHRKKTNHLLTDHLLATYRPPTDHLPTTYHPPTDHLPTTYCPPTIHLPTTYCPPTAHLPPTYQPPTAHLLTTYRSLKLSTYRPPTDHLLSTYRPHTNHFFTVQLVHDYRENY